jgi:hypothetical protein
LNSSTASTAPSPSGPPHWTYPYPVSGLEGGDTERHQQALRGAGHRLADHLDEALAVGDEVIGRERAHDRLWVAAADDRRGQRDGCARIPWRRLDQDVLFRYAGKLARHRCGVCHPGDHEDPIGCGQRRQPVDGGL